MFGLVFVVLLSYKYGVGGFQKKDIFSLIGAGIGLTLWYATKEPAYALFIVILIDFIASFLTIKKSYEDPKSETLSTWIMSSIAAFFGVLAVGKFNFILLAYPFFILLADSSIMIAILLASKKLK